MEIDNIKKENIEKLVNNNLSINKISRIIGKSNSSTRYWLKKYNLKTNGNFKEDKWSEEKLKNAVQKSECKSDVLRSLGISTKSGNFQTLERYLKKYNIDISNLKYIHNRGTFGNGRKESEKKYSNNEVFCVNSPLTNSKVKKRIIKENLIEYKCNECSLIDTWNNKKLVLQLDHINGINDDNRLENLRFLCPNCHSQTSTFSRMKKNKLW